MAPKRFQRHGLGTKDIEAYMETLYTINLEITAADLSDAADITIGDLNRSSKLWKVYRGKTPRKRGETTVTSTLLCHLPYKYFDAFRILQRFFQVAYHISSTLEGILNNFDGPEETQSRLEKVSVGHTHLTYHLYNVIQLAIKRMREGKRKRADYWNSRIDTLDIFLRVIYHSPKDVTEKAVQAALLHESDPLSYDWFEWAKTSNKERIYGTQPNSASEHAVLCKKVGIPVCPDIQVMTREEIQHLEATTHRRYLPTSDRTADDNNVTDGYGGHDSNNNSEGGVGEHVASDGSKDDSGNSEASSDESARGQQEPSKEASWKGQGKEKEGSERKRKLGDMADATPVQHPLWRRKLVRWENEEKTGQERT